ncbi:MAG: M15 family metallopeptidase [Candidatus Peregrinibacteria bacterium]|nr:M15 family metallopeptidase [Candidatus Peregrinibacteria bacterium]
MDLESGISDAKKGPEKQGESFFSKFNFGQFLGDAEKVKNDPELPKRVEAHKNKKVVHRKLGEKPSSGDNSETSEETELKKMADNLAHTAKKVEVKTDANDETKNTVKIDLDLAKFKDLPKAELTEVLTPDVKSCNLKIYETNAKGDREVKDEKVVFRGIEDGKVNYFFKDKSGKNIPVELPLTGGAELTISPDQLENKSRAEVLELMKEELVKTSQKALSKSMDAAADSLFEVPASGGSGGVRPSRSFAGPSYSPSASPSVDVGGYKPAETVRNTVINSAKNYEAVKGDLDNVTEEVAAKESPTGKPLLMNYSRNPELKQREPHYIMCIHGDYGNAKSFMNETLEDADKLRRAGVNAVVVSLEYAGVKDQMNSSWNFLKGKVDGLFGYCFEKFGKGKFDLVSFSGGYRAVETILKETKDLSQINTVSMLDSTYDWKGINDALENYVKAGGNVMAFTATERPNVGAKKIDRFLQQAAQSGEVKGSFKHLHKSGSHGSAAFMGEALAFAGGVQNVNPSELAKNGEILRAKDRILKYPISAEALALIQTFNPKDKFVEFENNGGIKNFQLRETPYKCLQLARQYAQADGFDIRISSGYRSVGTQSAAFGRSDKSGRMVAAPGKSWHQSGGAGDYQLVKDGRVLSSTSGRADRATGSKKEANDRLESYMNKAGFVRYEVEAWHFEVGSDGWLKIMAQTGALPKAYAEGGAYTRFQA